MSKYNRGAIETIEIHRDTMRKGLSEYEIEGRVTWLRGTLIDLTLPSVESGRGDGRRRYGRRLEPGLGAWRRDQRRRHLSNIGGSTSGIRERTRRSR
jgi:hypothetical protein